MFAKGSTPWFFIPVAPMALLVISLYLTKASFRFWYLYLFLALLIFIQVMLFIFFRDPERPIGKGIVSAADVRSFPTSRRFEHFKQEALREALAASGIEYMWSW